MTVLSLPLPAHPAVATRRHVRPLSADIARMTRYRGGTYSHTVDTVHFADGSSARTDLIRLNPNIAAYSLNVAGHAPTRPSHYRAETWSAVPNLRTRAHEAEVAWILRNSFPVLSTAELSRRLRAAGYPLGGANIAEHEAIAATQAAIWRFTNDLELDNRPRNVPKSAIRRSADTVVFEFDGEPGLGGYTVELVARGRVSLSLQKSLDGEEWTDVASSGLDVDGAGTYRKTLGIGSTVSHSRRGGRVGGYRYYRLVIDSPRPAEVGVREVTFRLDGAATYRNPDRIVHLYDYLLAGARAADRHTAVADLDSADATVDGSLVGPFRLRSAGSVLLTARDGTVIDADGVELSGQIEPGAEFYISPHTDADGVFLTATVPGTPHGVGGRVVTGVAHDDANSRLTPLALAKPAPLVVDFAVYWSATGGR
jgi:TQXA domain-containing protein